MESVKPTASESARGGAVSGLFSFLHVSPSQLCLRAAHDWVGRSVWSWASARKAHSPTYKNHEQHSQLFQ